MFESRSAQSIAQKLAIACIVLGIIGQLPFWLDSPPSFEKLELVEGKCVRVLIKRAINGTPMIRIGIHKGGSERVARLDTDLWYKRFTEFAIGDSLQAWVAHDSWGRDTEWIWQIARKGTMVLSYQEIVSEELRSQKALSYFGLAFVILGLALGAYAWRLNKQEESRPN